MRGGAVTTIKRGRPGGDWGYYGGVGPTLGDYCREPTRVMAGATLGLTMSIMDLIIVARQKFI